MDVEFEFSTNETITSVDLISHKVRSHFKLVERRETTLYDTIQSQKKTVLFCQKTLEFEFSCQKTKALKVAKEQPQFEFFTQKALKGF